MNTAVLAGIFSLAGACVGAGASLLGVWWRESYARLLDRRALAAALLAEVELLLKAVAVEREVYGRLEKLFSRPEGADDLSVLRVLEAQKGALDYRVSVYEKCAQQIGQLDPEVAKGLVRFFYFIDGVRDEIRPIVFNQNLTREFRVQALSGVLKIKLPEGIQEGANVRHRLATLANAAA